MKKARSKFPKLKKTLLELNKFGRKTQSSNAETNPSTKSTSSKSSDKSSDKKSQTSVETLESDVLHSSSEMVPTYSIPEDHEHEDVDDVDTEDIICTDSRKYDLLGSFETDTVEEEIKPEHMSVPLLTSSRSPEMLQKNNSDNSRQSLSSGSKYTELLIKASDSETSILMELDLNGNITYLSELWKQIVGTNPDDLLGVSISDLVVGNFLDKTVFQRTTDLMLQDDSSYRIKFTLEQFVYNENITSEKAGDILADRNERDPQSENSSFSQSIPTASSTSSSRKRNFLELEAQGIIIHDTIHNTPVYSMWIMKPFYDIDEFDNLPVELVEKLGFGALLFQKYLDLIEKQMVLNEDDLPPNDKEICRICENHIISWWLEPHCELCLFEHNLYNKITIVHDNLVDCKQVLLKIKETMLTLKSLYHVSVNSAVTQPMECEPIQYRDVKIDVMNLYFSFIPTLNLFISFCDDAINTNNSEISTCLDIPIENIDFEFSPSSKRNIDNVKDWEARLLILFDNIDNAKFANFKILLSETLRNSELKIQHLLRLQNTQKYHFRLNTEITLYTQELIKQKIESNFLNMPYKHLSDGSNATPFLHDLPNQDTGRDLSMHSRPVSSQKLASPAPQRIQKSFFNQTYLENSGDSIPSSALGKPMEENRAVEPVYSPTFSMDCESSQEPSKNNEVLLSSLKNDKSTSEVAKESSMSPLGNTNFNASPKAQDRIVQVPRGNTFTSYTRNSSLNSSSARPSIPNSSSDEHNSFAELGAISSSGVSRQSSEKTRQRSNISRYNTLASLASSPRRSSPLSAAGSLTTQLSVIKKNPTVKSLMDKSPLTSPFLTPLESEGMVHQSSTSTTQSLLTALQPQPSLSPLISIKSGPPLSYRHSSNLGIVDYEIVKPISKGAFGSVYLSKRKFTGEYFAIKVLKKSDMISKNQVTNIKEERAILMSQIDKTYTAKLHATFQNKENLFLVMEYLPGGDLAALVKMVGILPEKWTKQYLSEVIYGVEDMHKNGIIHRDLKPDNLLLDRRGHVKFIDFGLSRRGLVHRQRIKAPPSSNNVFATGSTTKHNTNVYNNANQSASSLLQQTRRKSSQDESPAIKLHDFSLNDTVGDPNADLHIKKSQFNIPHANQESDAHSTGILEASRLKESGSNYFFTMSGISRSSTPVNGHTRNTSTSSTGTCHSIQSCDNDNQKEANERDFVIYDPQDKTVTDKKFMGTPDYLAPEVILGEGESAISDWWSVGCILFEFMFAYPPFHASTPTEIFQNILNGKIKWPLFEDEEEEHLFISPEAKDLILKLLTVDPKKRLGANGVEEIKQQPYFAGIDWNTLYEEEAEFVPNVSHPEDTDYFDQRGATMDIDFQLSDSPNQDSPGVFNGSMLTGFTDEMENNSMTVEEQSYNVSPPLELEPSSISSMLETLHTNISEDSLNSNKLEVPRPTHSNTQKLAESQTEFGSFNFRNIAALDKANKDVINRLKTEHLGESAQISASASSSSGVSQHQRNTSLTEKLRTNYFRRDSGESSKSSKKPADILINESMLDSYNTSSGQSSDTSTNRINKSFLKRNSESSNASISYSKTNNSSTQSLDALITFDEERFDALSKLKLIRASKKKGTAIVPTDFESNKLTNIRFDFDALLCEPIPIHSYIITSHLQQLGCRVVAVSNGDELVRRATSDVKFDIIFSTFLLPSLSSAAIFKLIRNTNGTNCSTPFVILTAYYNEALKLRLFDDVIEKPIRIDPLRKTLSKYALKKAKEEEDPVLSDVESELYF